MPFSLFEDTRLRDPIEIPWASGALCPTHMQFRFKPKRAVTTINFEKVSSVRQLGE